MRAALAANPDVELFVIKNTSKGAKRYMEVLRELRRVKREHNPDVYWLNFRGFEILPFVQMIAGRKPVVYDEMVNPVLVVTEHRRLKKGAVKALMGLWPLFGKLYYVLAKKSDVILTDTAAHGVYSTKHGNMPAGKYRAFPVGADETLFKPKPTTQAKPFQVFFYSPESQPLHGIPYILEAAVKLAKRKDIKFVIAGNKGSLGEQIADAVAKGARIRHETWIEFEKLPDVMRESGVCLGGPFGGTPQAQVVVTGKTYQMMACQAPVIIGEAPTTTEFTDKKDSIIVPQANADALAEAIVWAAEHPRELKTIAANGRKLFEKKFSSKVIEAELAKILQALPR